MEHLRDTDNEIGNAISKGIALTWQTGRVIQHVSGVDKNMHENQIMPDAAKQNLIYLAEHGELIDEYGAYFHDFIANKRIASEAFMAMEVMSQRIHIYFDELDLEDKVNKVAFLPIPESNTMWMWMEVKELIHGTIPYGIEYDINAEYPSLKVKLKALVSYAEDECTVPEQFQLVYPFPSNLQDGSDA